MPRPSRKVTLNAPNYAVLNSRGRDDYELEELLGMETQSLSTEGTPPGQGAETDVFVSLPTQDPTDLSEGHEEPSTDGDTPADLEVEASESGNERTVLIADAEILALREELEQVRREKQLLAEERSKARSKREKERLTQLISQERGELQGLQEQQQRRQRKSQAASSRAEDASRKPGDRADAHSAGLNRLKGQVQQTLRSAFATGTYKNLKIQWRSYFLFCVHFGLKPLPASTMNICLYAQFLSRSFKAVDSIRNYLSGIKLLHLLLNLPVPDFGVIDIRLVLRGLRRLNTHQIRRACPVSPHLLIEFRSLLDLNKPLQATYWALFLLAFFLMARKSNLVADSVHSFDGGKQLTRGDIVSGGDCLLVLIKWSKTIQFGQRELRVPVLAIPNSVLCPVRAYTHMIRLVPVPSTSPAFCLQGGKIPLTYPKLQSFLKRLVERTGRNPELFSSHSFRRGGASWAFANQVPGELIQLVGDWKSDAYKNYLELGLEDKVRVSQGMRDGILTAFS